VKQLLVAADKKKTTVEAHDKDAKPSVPPAAKQPAAPGGSAAEAPGAKQETKEEKK